jgi:hypothetical protein
MPLVEAILTNAGGVGLALGVVYILLKSNEYRLRHLRKEQIIQGKQIEIIKLDMADQAIINGNNLKATEDCFEGELKGVREDIIQVNKELDCLCDNTDAIIGHLIATTDRGQHPHAVEALEVVLQRAKDRRK